MAVKANPGALWEQVAAVSRRALDLGALRPIETHCEPLRDGDVCFAVRRAIKPAAKTPAPHHARRTDPFLPYEQALYVADLSATHVALLNKYNVFDHHLLIITRAYEDQAQWLTLADFEALRTSMAAVDGMGFYNGGRDAGASQPHKHLQVVRLPLAPWEPGIPITPMLAPAGAPSAGTIHGRLPVVHGVRHLAPQWYDAPGDGARELLTTYHALLRDVGLVDSPHVGDGLQAGPYNLIVTREWMLLVPRRCETWQGITVNALGVAGAVLVWSDEQMRQLKEHGPMAALRYVCLPRP